MTDAPDRTDWLLLLLGRDALGVGGPDALDPVRIQKAMFLASERGPSMLRGLYKFRPYNWGPFSPTLYGDLDDLAFRGLVDATDVPGQSWKRYSLTSAGQRRAGELAEGVATNVREWLGQLRLFVTTRSFAKLLNDVYELYPEYATKSLFRAG